MTENADAPLRVGLCLFDQDGNVVVNSPAPTTSGLSCRWHPDDDIPGAFHGAVHHEGAVVASISVLLPVEDNETVKEDWNEIQNLQDHDRPGRACRH